MTGKSGPEFFDDSTVLEVYILKRANLVESKRYPRETGAE